MNDEEGMDEIKTRKVPESHVMGTRSKTRLEIKEFHVEQVCTESSTQEMTSSISSTMVTTL